MATLISAGFEPESALVMIHFLVQLITRGNVMFKKLLLLVLLMASPWSAYAAQPSAESIERLLTITKAEALLDSIYTNTEQVMRQAMAQSLAGQALSPEQKRFLDTVPQRFTELMRDELSWANLKPMYVQIYQESFTQEEIDGLIAFYGTPAGQATINKMPVVMQKSMAAIQTHMQPLLEKMRPAIEQAMKDAKAMQ